MKNLMLPLAFTAAAGLLIGFASGRERATKESEAKLKAANTKIAELTASIPAQQVPLGFTFAVPGMDGEVKITVDRTELIRAYHMTGSDGNDGMVTEEALVAGLETLGIPIK